METCHPLRSDVIEAWNRLLNRTCTGKDLALISESLKEGDPLHEFNYIFERVKNEANAAKSHLTDKQKEAYRKEAYQLILDYERKREVPVSPVISLVRKIGFAAAAVLLCILIPASYLIMKSKTETETVEMITRQGEIKAVSLPDGTEVTLNVGSRIKYPTHFSDNERSVELYGEALFNVTGDPERPFIVKTGDMNIKVLGTVFNVKAYDNDLSSSVSVASGKVEVGLNDVKVMLEPNQQVKTDKTTGKYEKLNIDAGKYISWTNGIFYFQRTPIHEVVNILNRHYPQVEIELAKGEYNNILITGEYNDAFDPEKIIRRIITATDLKCKKTGNKYTLYTL